MASSLPTSIRFWTRLTINGFILQAGERHRPVRFPGQTITGFPGATRNHPVFYPAPSTGNNHHKITTNRPMKPLNFIAIDFETANAKRSSICEVGICVVRNGEISETRSWLVQPEDNFYHYRNIQIHGIRPEDTENAPDFKQVWEEIERTYLDEFDTLLAAAGSRVAPSAVARPEMGLYSQACPSSVCLRKLYAGLPVRLP